MMAQLELLSGIERWIPVAAVFAAALPGSSLVTSLVASSRVRSGPPAPSAWTHSIAEVGIVAGTLPWLWMILTPIAAASELRLVPLLDIWRVLHGPAPWALHQIVG